MRTLERDEAGELGFENGRGNQILGFYDKGLAQPDFIFAWPKLIHLVGFFISSNFFCYGNTPFVIYPVGPSLFCFTIYILGLLFAPIIMKVNYKYIKHFQKKNEK